MGRRRRFIGCIADPSTIVEKRSWDDLPENRAQELEVTPEAIEEISNQMEGLAIKINHSKTNVKCGEVNRAWYDEEEKKWMLDFSIEDDSTYIGGSTGSLIDSGVMPGLSLAHELFTNKPKEVSLCWLPARPWSYIEQEVISDTETIPYNSRNQQPVIDTDSQCALNRNEPALSLSNEGSVVHATATFVRQPDVAFARKGIVNASTRASPFVFLKPSVTMFKPNMALLAMASKKKKKAVAAATPPVQRKAVAAAAATAADDDNDDAEIPTRPVVVEASAPTKKQTKKKNTKLTTKASTTIMKLRKPPMSAADARNSRMAASPYGSYESQLDRVLGPQGEDSVFGTPPAGGHGEEDDQFEFGQDEEGAEEREDGELDEMEEAEIERAGDEGGAHGHGAEDRARARERLEAAKKNKKQASPPARKADATAAANGNSKRKRKPDGDAAFETVEAAASGNGDKPKKKNKAASANPVLGVLDTLPEDQQITIYEQLERSKRVERENARLKRKQKKIDEEHDKKLKEGKREMGDALAGLIESFGGAAMSKTERENLRSGDTAVAAKQIVEASKSATDLLKKLKNEEATLIEQRANVNRQRLGILKERVVGVDDDAESSDDDIEEEENGDVDEDEPPVSKGKRDRDGRFVKKNKKKTADKHVEHDSDDNDRYNEEHEPSPSKAKKSKNHHHQTRRDAPDRHVPIGEMDDDTAGHIVRASAGIFDGCPREMTKATLPKVVADNAWFRENARSLAHIRALTNARTGKPWVTHAGMKALLGVGEGVDGRVYKPRGHQPFRPGDHQSEYSRKISYLNKHLKEDAAADEGY